MNRTDWDAYFASLIGDTGTGVPGLAVLAYADGREVYRFAAGVRRVDGERSWPMTVDSRFRMASVSKMFTVFTLMELAEDDASSLIDDVSQYLGFRLRHPLPPTSAAPQADDSLRISACAQGLAHRRRSVRFSRPSLRQVVPIGKTAPILPRPGRHRVFILLIVTSITAFGTHIDAMGQRFMIGQSVRFRSPP